MDKQVFDVEIILDMLVILRNQGIDKKMIKACVDSVWSLPKYNDDLRKILVWKDNYVVQKENRR